MADKITPEAFEQLQSDLKSAQEAAKSAQALQESVAKLEENNKALLQEKADAKKAAQAAAEEAARKGGDVEALEKSWQEKLATETASRDEKLSAYQKTIQKMTVGNAARAMASELALPGSADVLLPHIEKRLQVEMTDGSPLVRVLDKDGKPSASSIEDLRKEIESDAAFAPLLLGSKANGSGDVGKKGESVQSTIKRADFDALSPSERMKTMKDKVKVVD
jgi:FtsZ-binding cell division protein ZapB